MLEIFNKFPTYFTFHPKVKTFILLILTSFRLKLQINVCTRHESPRHFEKTQRRHRNFF